MLVGIIVGYGKEGVCVQILRPKVCISLKDSGWVVSWCGRKASVYINIGRLLQLRSIIVTAPPRLVRRFIYTALSCRKYRLNIHRLRILLPSPSPCSFLFFLFLHQTELSETGGSYFIVTGTLTFLVPPHLED